MSASDQVPAEPRPTTDEQACPAEVRLDAVRTQAQAMVDELGNARYSHNPWAVGVRDQALSTLAKLNGDE